MIAARMHNMKNLLNQLACRMASFMQGRNGMDTCARWAFGAGLVCTILDLLFASGALSTLGLVLFVYSMFRCYSSNIASRALENAKFEHAMRKPIQQWEHLNLRWTNRKTTKYFKCKQCGQSLSVPKGRGKLRTTCPKCGHQTEISS